MSATDAKTLVDELCELSPDARAAWFAEHDVDPAVRAEVERVLAHFDVILRDSEALPSPDLGEVAASEPGQPDTIGAYRVLDTLGSGGMGVVYRAEQSDPRRVVAVKVLRGRLLTTEAEARFAREAEFLGKLQHPGIAQVIEFGRTPEGEAFLVLEFIDGSPITRDAERRGLDQDARLRLLVDLADAVHHAHLRGVVHRDLKPGNVLVTAEGQVKVIDFGVARAVDDELLLTQATRPGQVLGTLAYMAPEQMRGELDDIDARVDVYALGVLAYELLGGRLPHDLATANLAHAARVLEESDPPRLGRVAPDCRGDLEWIVGRALEKHPARRYASAAAFAADLRRFLAHETVEARPPTLAYQLTKLARRHRGFVLGASLALAALVIGAAVAVDQALENRDLAQREGEARRDAEDAQVLAEDAQALAEARADDFERMTLALEAQLREIDRHAVGVALRELLERDVDAALEDSTAAPEQREARLAAFLAELESVDLPRVALAALDTAMFAPAADRLAEQFADEPVIQARLLRSLAHAEMNVGLLASADAHYARARELLLTADGGETPLSLALLLDVAHARGQRGGVREALALVEGREQELEAALAGTLELGRLHGLRAFAARYAGDLESALQSYATALEHFESASSATDVDFDAASEALSIDALSTRADLGLMLCQTERFGEGVPQLETVLAQLERARAAGELPPSLAMLRLRVLADAGYAMCRSGRGEEGEPLLRRAVDDALELVGGTHGRTATARAQLGRWLAETRRCEEAASVLEAALRTWCPGTGRLSMSCFEPLVFLVRCDLDRGRLDEALAFAEELYALTTAMREFRPDLHHQGVMSLHTVARALADRDPASEWGARAEELLAEAEALRPR